MPLDPDRLGALDIPTRQAAYQDRDVLLYALSLGAGLGSDLALVQEEGLRVIPSFAQVLAFDDSWMEAGGVELAHAVHGSLDLRFAGSLAPSGKAEVRSCIAGLTDKGAGRGGIIHQEVTIAEGGRDVCTALSSIFIRGGGGFGGSTGHQPAADRLPELPVDAVVEVPTRPDQALFFRLLGDRNPLHSLPEVATKAGFERPILHGACTFGVACLTVLERYCAGRPERMKRFAARFSGPLYPGETLVFEFRSAPGAIAFRASAKERDAPVLDAGIAEVGEGDLHAGHG